MALKKVKKISFSIPDLEVYYGWKFDKEQRKPSTLLKKLKRHY